MASGPPAAADRQPDAARPVSARPPARATRRRRRDRGPRERCQPGWARAQRRRCRGRAGQDPTAGRRGRPSAEPVRRAAASRGSRSPGRRPRWRRNRRPRSVPDPRPREPGDGAVEASSAGGRRDRAARSRRRRASRRCGSSARPSRRPRRCGTTGTSGPGSRARSCSSSSAPASASRWAAPTIAGRLPARGLDLPERPQPAVRRRRDLVPLLAAHARSPGARRPALEPSPPGGLASVAAGSPPGSVFACIGSDYASVAARLTPPAAAGAGRLPITW